MSYTPKTINVDKNNLTLTWLDGLTNSFSAQELRAACNCASCVSEITGERTLDTNKIAESIQITAAEPTGNYAVSLKFSDNHNTGIYSFEYLKKMKQMS